MFFCFLFKFRTPYHTPYRILRLDFFKVGLHPRGTLFFHFFRDVTIHVKRKARRGVTEVLLYRFHVIPLLQSRDGVGVAEIMKTRIGTLDLGCNRLEAFERGLWDDIFTRLVGKDEVKGVLPCQPHGEVIRSLGLLHLFENIHDEGSDGKRPHLVIFGGSNVMLTAFFLFLAELLLDRDCSLAEVDRIP